ncbi:Arsenic resistance transcriptional regulator ArsR2 [BD1-7 clade bacterium]|uniref:Arsenic resistance transcriptional regulator ArsR2 n=1 Tax=BD1-7 clade bacterium TaxID=2029982 RepID=A0A5S9NSD5_9GAMM|nr:Arsenic resistance transcriptional regulator ArsR2 [BD1-7 clade bacterium]CAA0093553.1 Arsenic resistance transcriptional regulator ArsR2 [BD1-7 clade bacterium]
MDESLKLFKALADETRLQLILLLTHGPMCVCDLMSAIDESQPKVSRHLALLRDDNILVGERKGKWVYYELNPDLPENWTQILNIAANTHKEELLQKVSHLNTCETANPQRCN